MDVISLISTLPLPPPAPRAGAASTESATSNAPADNSDEPRFSLADQADEPRFSQADKTDRELRSLPTDKTDREPRSSATHKTDRDPCASSADTSASEPSSSPADQATPVPADKPESSSTQSADTSGGDTSSGATESTPQATSEATVQGPTTLTDQATAIVSMAANALTFAQAEQASIAAPPVALQTAQPAEPTQTISDAVQATAQPTAVTAQPTAQRTAATAQSAAATTPATTTTVPPTAGQGISAPIAPQAKANIGASTTQTSTDPESTTTPSGGDGEAQLLPQGLRAQPTFAQQLQKLGGESTATAPNALTSLLDGAHPSAQQATAPAAAQLDVPQQAVHTTDGNSAAPIQTKQDAAPSIAAAFGTDLIGPAGAKTGATAYEVARSAAPIQPASEQVALSIHRAIGDGIDRLTVELKPASLGRVSAEIEFHDDHRVHVVLSADRPATLDALRNDSRALERALQDAGLRTDAGSLSFRFQQSGDQPGFRPDGTPARFAAPSILAGDDFISTTTPAGALLRPGGVDIHV